MDAQPRSAFVFGPFRLDPIRRTLTRGGGLVELSPRLFDTLLYFVERPDQVLTKDDLLEAIWPSRIVEEGNLSQAIFALRKALRGDDDDPQMIVTVPGRGYRLAASVSIDTLEPAQGAARLWRWPRRRMQAVLVAGAAALALVIAVTNAFTHQALAPGPAGRRTLVLADFQNLNAEPGFELVLGKTLDVDLSQSPYLTVLSRQQIADTLDLMTKPKASLLTPELAAGVCERNGGGAVVAGQVAGLGAARYLVTLAATDCATGRTFSEAKVEADGKAAAVRALDSLAGRMRAKLGESLKSIARFSAPLLATKTSSFAALEAYSEGVNLYNHGERAESVPLFQHAIELDPNFTMAWSSLGAAYYVLHQDVRAAEAISRAYALRSNADEPQQMKISELYDTNVTKDIDAAIRDDRLWTELYPNDAAAWSSLANAETWIGQSDAAVDAGKHALALSPTSEAAYAILVRAYMHVNQFDAAVEVGRQAIAKGLAGDDVRVLLAEIAFGRGDKAALDEQIGWAKGKPAERILLVDEALMAMSEGRLRAARALFEQMAELGRQQGLADYTGAARARLMTDFGMPEQARALLASLPADYDSQDYRYATAAVGDEKKARAMLERDLAKAPADTLLNRDFAPSIRAALLMRRGKAAEAARTLRPTVPFELRNFDLMYQAGQAFLAAGDPAGAARKFQAMLANPGLQPDDPLLPLAHLGLARALAKAVDTAGARREYAAFLGDWRSADPDIPVLLQAKRESARLG